jgi:hypothetical protein
VSSFPCRSFHRCLYHCVIAVCCLMYAKCFTGQYLTSISSPLCIPSCLFSNIQRIMCYAETYVWNFTASIPKCHLAPCTLVVSAPKSITTIIRWGRCPKPIYLLSQQRTISCSSNHPRPANAGCLRLPIITMCLSFRPNSRVFGSVRV